MSLTFARRRLDYPLYAADFDPLNPDFLLVGGGGGWTASGVPNKITLLDTSIPAALNEVLAIDLAKNEDSVSSLVVAESTPASLIAYAGINSSAEDQTAGRNEHFRSFIVGLPPRKRKANDTTPLSPEKSVSSVSTSPLERQALFTSAKGSQNDTYQRILRVCPTDREKGKRLVAIATGLAPENEVIALRPSPIAGSVDEVSRIALGKAEAADVDVEEYSSGDFHGHLLAYCTDDEVYIQRIPRTKLDPISKTRLLHRMSETTLDLSSSKRPRLKCLRFLTPEHILLLRNKPGRTGAELLILKTDQDHTQGKVTFQRRLNISMKAAVGLDVCRLSESSNGEKQIIIAVAGQDSSIEILTIDFVPGKGLSALKSFTVLRDVHPQAITKLIFSNSPSTSNDGTRQSIRLASVSVGQTVAVHTLPLKLYSAKLTSPRYVFVTPGPARASTTLSITMAILVVCLCVLLNQVIGEIRGSAPSKLGVADWLTPSLRESVAGARKYAPGPVIPEELPSVISSATARVKDATSNIPSIDDLKEQAKNAASQIPSVEEIKEQARGAAQYIPSVDEMREQAKNAASQIPGVDAIKEQARGAAEYIPSIDDVREQARGVAQQIPSVDDLKRHANDAAQYIPSGEDLKEHAAQYIPSSEDLKKPANDAAQYVPSSEDLKQQVNDAAQYIPSSEDLRRQANDAAQYIPSSEDLKRQAKDAAGYVPSGEDLKKQANDAAQYVPSGEDIRNQAKVAAQYAPSSEDLKEQANVPAQHVPSSEDLQGQAKDTVAHIPSVDELKEQLSSLPSVEDVRADLENLASSNLPSTGDVRSNLPDLPSMKDVRSNLPNLPSTEDVKAALPNLPATEDIKSNLPNSPSTEDIKSNLPSLPSTEDIKSNLPSLPSTEDLKHTLQKIQNLISRAAPGTPKSIVVRDQGESGLLTELHHGADVVKHETLKRWEDLTKDQQKGWRRKLVDAGKWTEKQGEAVLKGVLFSELAGAVGAAIRG